MVIKSLKLIFIHIPRTGGTTIENIFETQLGISRAEYLPSVQLETVKTQPDFVHETIHNIKHKIFPNHPEFENEDFDAYETFSIIRDPATWAESLYNYFKLYYPLPDSIETFVHDEMHPAHLTRFQPHSQLEYLTDHRTGELLVDNVFVFEQYGDALRFVERKLGKSVESVPHIFEIGTVLENKNGARSALDEKGKDAVRRYYADDVRFHEARLQRALDAAQAGDAN